MPVGRRIAEAVRFLQEGNFEGAWGPLCQAIEATAKRRNPSEASSATRFKQFLKDNMIIITKGALGNIMCDGETTFVPSTPVPGLKLNAKGGYTIADVLYHAVRCTVVHEACLPLNITFVDESALYLSGKNMVIPKAIVTGLLLAIVGEGVNSGAGVELAYNGVKLDWGNREQILELVDAHIVYDETSWNAITGTPGNPLCEMMKEGLVKVRRVDGSVVKPLSQNGEWILP